MVWLCEPLLTLSDELAEGCRLVDAGATPHDMSKDGSAKVRSIDL